MEELIVRMQLRVLVEELQDTPRKATGVTSQEAFLAFATNVVEVGILD